VGLNLFLASYRFKRPLMEIAVASLPMLAIRGVACCSSPMCPVHPGVLMYWDAADNGDDARSP